MRHTPASPPRACPNCATQSAGRYCPACGQDNGQERLTTRAVLLDALANFVNWDSALMMTLRGLFTRPGEVAREYVRGRRKRYVSPARLCLITLALWLVVTRWLGVDPLEAAGFRFDSNEPGSRAAQIAAEVRAFLGAHLDLLLYLALPLKAWLTKRLFPRTDDNLAECFVLVLFVASFGFLIGILLTPLAAFEPRAAMTLRQLIGFIWAIRAAREFFGVGWISAALRMALVVALHMLGAALLFALLALPFIL